MKLLTLALRCFGMAVAGVFALHHEFLSLGFYLDDYEFFAPASQGGYGTRSAAFYDYLGFWNPWRGWFYRPVFLTYFAFVQSAAGANATAFHALGLLLHAAVVAALGLLALRLTSRRSLALACAAAFLLWPGKEEAVWWVASHSAILAALFSLLSLHAWLSWRRRGRRRWLLGSLACFWLALCSKSDAASLPAALLLLDLWHDASGGKTVREWLRTLPRRWREFLPLLLLSALFVLCESAASRHYGQHGDPHVKLLRAFPLGARLIAVAHVVDRLLLRALPFGPPGAGTLASLLVVTLAARRVIPPPRTARPLGFFLLWAGAAALPVPLLAAWHATASRFLYLPAMPVSCAAVLLSYRLGLYLLHAGEASPGREVPPRVDAAQLFGAAFFAAAVSHLYFPGKWGIAADPALSSMILFAALAAGLVLWRFHCLRGSHLALLFAAAVGTQLEVYAPTEPAWIYLSAGLALGAGIGIADGAAGIACAVFLILVLWNLPGVALPAALLFLTATDMLPSRKLQPGGERFIRPD